MHKIWILLFIIHIYVWICKGKNAVLFASHWQIQTFHLNYYHFTFHWLLVLFYRNVVGIVIYTRLIQIARVGVGIVIYSGLARIARRVGEEDVMFPIWLLLDGIFAMLVVHWNWKVFVLWQVGSSMLFYK